MFRSKGGKTFLQKAAVETRVVGDNEHYPVEQIVDGVFVDALTGDHLIGNAGHASDLRRDRKARIFEPFPRAEDFVDPSALAVILEEVDPQFDNSVAVGVSSGGFDIRDSSDQLWGVIGWVVLGLRFQPTSNPIIAALDERSAICSSVGSMSRI